jgi:hypothetical protein
MKSRMWQNIQQGLVNHSALQTVSVGRHEIEIIPDIELKRGEIKYCFSDGVGKISYEYWLKKLLKNVVARII